MNANANCFVCGCVFLFTKAMAIVMRQMGAGRRTSCPSFSSLPPSVGETNVGPIADIWFTAAAMSQTFLHHQWISSEQLNLFEAQCQNYVKFAHELRDDRFLSHITSKPKTHQMLHASDMVRKYGCLMDVTTEYSESCNKIIRAFVNNSTNKQRISRDTCLRFSVQYASTFLIATSQLAMDPELWRVLVSASCVLCPLGPHEEKKYVVVCVLC